MQICAWKDKLRWRHFIQSFCFALQDVPVCKIVFLLVVDDILIHKKLWFADSKVDLAPVTKNNKVLCKQLLKTVAKN